ncbi:MAG: ABC transporter ATP-binding protein [Chloroflexi bacterium]|nr:ABC transporter ATP-binding protein [Chloroflexota bacterium]
MSLLRTIDLTKTYRVGPTVVRALGGVDLAVESGEMVSIMGRSGSGKSTLLNIIGCLDRPTSGRVIIDGLEVTQVPAGQLPRVRREKIGFVFQHFNLIPGLTALENATLGLRYAGVSSRRRGQRGLEVLEEVGLSHRRHHRPAQLSGGEIQRVAIARALANRPALVLADEPTGELDTATSAEIVALLCRLNRETGQTFLVVTHDPQVAGRMHRTLHLRDGRLDPVRRGFTADGAEAAETPALARA